MRIFLALAFLLTSVVAFAKSEKAVEVFTLDHQMSSMCEKKIKENLRFEKGISKIDVSLKDNTITITFDPKKTDTEKIIAGFKKIGFTAFPVDCLVPSECATPQVCPETNGATEPAACPHGCCSTPK